MSIKIILSSKNAKTSCDEVCRVTVKEDFDEDYVNSIVKKFATASHPIRLKILLLTLKHGELTTCEFERALGQPQSVVSYHLQVLVDADILQRNLYRQWSLYRMKDDSFFHRALKAANLKEKGVRFI
jgi:DNA-binding transcriptional ArsR family regulator